MVHSTTKMAQKSVMKVFIGISGRTKHTGGTFYLNLWQRGKKRNKYNAATAVRGLISGRIDIAHRPAIINAKTRLGDWKLDGIIGAKQGGAITSMVEWMSNLRSSKRGHNKPANTKQELFSHFDLR